MYLTIKIKEETVNKVLNAFESAIEKSIAGKTTCYIFDCQRRLYLTGYWHDEKLQTLTIETASGKGFYKIKKSGRIYFEGRRNSLKSGNDIIQIEEDKVHFYDHWWSEHYEFEGLEAEYKIEEFSSRFPMIKPWNEIDDYCLSNQKIQYKEVKVTKKITPYSSVTNSYKISNVVSVHDKALKERNLKNKKFRLRAIQRKGTSKLVAIPVGVNINNLGKLSCYEVYGIDFPN